MLFKHSKCSGNEWRNVSLVNLMFDKFGKTTLCKNKDQKSPLFSPPSLVLLPWLILHLNTYQKLRDNIGWFAYYL